MAVLGALTVDVVSDVVCPWCYIGKRRLEAALGALREAEPDLPIEVRWHPFQLNPDLPPDGRHRRQYSTPSSAGRSAPARSMRGCGRVGETVDIPFAFDAIERQPNTLDAHRLIAWAQSRREGDADALVEQLFRAYFLEGRYVGTTTNWCAVAVAGRLRSRRCADVPGVRRDEGGSRRGDQRAREMGVRACRSSSSTARRRCPARTSRRRCSTRLRRRARQLDELCRYPRHGNSLHRRPRAGGDPATSTQDTGSPPARGRR